MSALLTICKTCHGMGVDFTCNLSLFLHFCFCFSFVAFLNFATLQLFFDLYRALPTSLSPMVSEFGFKGFATKVILAVCFF